MFKKRFGSGRFMLVTGPPDLVLPMYGSEFISALYTIASLSSDNDSMRRDIRSSTVISGTF
jgi:hypothetical protein